MRWKLDHLTKGYRCNVRLWSVAVAAMLCVAPVAQAQSDYPNRPIRLIVGYGPGGTADIISRAVADRISKSLGQPVVIENRPGAGQTIAASTAAKAPPDGYTLFLMTSGQASSVALFRSLSYDVVKDFEPISTFGFFDIVLVADKASRLKSVGDVLSAAKQAPDALNIGTPAVGSGQHLSAELFKSLSGLPLTLVPFRTTPELISSLKGNVVQTAFEMLVPVKGMVESGDLKVLAISSEKRFPGLPDVPTFREAGFPAFDASPWNGLAAPAGTPRPIIERLNAVVNEALASEDLVKKFQAMGMTLRGSTPQALKQLLAADIVKWTKVVEDAKIEKR